MEKLVYIAVGWLLGQFGQIIMDTFRRSFRREKVKKTLHVELDELRYDMAIVAQKAHFRYASPSREFLRRLVRIFDSYSGSQKGRNYALSAINEVVNLSDSKLSAYYNLNRRPGVSGLLPRQYSPYLEQQLDAISLFSIEVQRTLLNIISQLHILNHQIGSIEWHHKKTFDETMTTDNRQIVDSTIDELSKSVGRRACHMSNLITDLFNEWGIEGTGLKIEESLFRDLTRN